MIRSKIKKFEIISEDGRTKVIIDGVEQKGLRDITFRHHYQGLPELTLSFIPYYTEDDAPDPL